jgi:hypothetical protein
MGGTIHLLDPSGLCLRFAWDGIPIAAKAKLPASLASLRASVGRLRIAKEVVTMDLL